MPEHISIISKYFDELTTKELYEILKARAEIFVVEQNCVYQDLDDVDYRSLHILWKAGLSEVCVV
jgi:ElaA protein